MLAITDLITHHRAMLLGLGTASLIMFAVSLVVLPAIILALPPHFFLRYADQGGAKKKRGFGVVLLKNLIGFILTGSGIVLLFLPGQGLLMIFIGIVLMDFPGKRRLVRHLLRNRQLHRSLNWIRRQAGRPPLLFPSSSH